MSTVNSQITDAVSQTTTLLTGQSPSQAMGMLDAVLLDTLGVAMHNAVMRQANSHTAASAAVTAACAKMLSVPFLINSPTPPLSPPVVTPLPTPPASPTAVVAAAYADAETAVNVLKAAEATGGAAASTAEADLQAIANLATEGSSSPGA